MSIQNSQIVLFAGAVAFFPGQSAQFYSGQVTPCCNGKAGKAARAPAFGTRRSLQVVNVATLEVPPKEVLAEFDGKIKIGINGEPTSACLRARSF